MATPTKWGNEFLANTITNNTQSDAAVTKLADGGFVVAWTDLSLTLGDSFGLGNASHAQVFNADGSKRGAEFLVNTPTPAAQEFPVLTALADGRFVAAWQDSDNYFDVRAQIFNADGSKSGGEFAVNSTTADGQYAPTLTTLTDGRFVAAWVDHSAGNADIRAQAFNSDGTKSGVELLVNTFTNGDQNTPDIVGLSDGRFVVAWEDYANPANANIRVQIFNADGTTSGGAHLVDSLSAVDSHGSAVTALPGGRFVVAWSDSSGIHENVHAQIFNSDGTKSGPIFDAGAGPGSVTKSPALATLPDGRFVAVSTLDADVGGLTVVGQVFNPDGSKSGSAFSIDYAFPSGDHNPDVSVLADGRIVVSWTDIYPGDGSSSGISAQIFDPREAAVHLNGADLNDQWVGTKFNDTMNGGAGDDTAVFSQNLDKYSVSDIGAKTYIWGTDGLDTLTGVEHLQFADGTVNINDGHLLFDTLHYMRENLDVFHAGANALDHFNNTGWHEGRDPNAWFDTSGYLAVNTDVAAAGINPLEHYHQSGWHEGRDPSADFDTTLYLIHNPDVAAAGMDPLLHYLQFGIAEGRSAYEAVGPVSNGFDAQFYLFHNPDVAAAGVDPLTHYNTSGWHEGRNPNAYFDTVGYLAHYTDVAAAGINPLQHYEAIGWTEGRDPSAQFDTLKYLAANPDVAAAHINPLDHFLQNGIYEGRAAINDGQWL